MDHVTKKDFLKLTNDLTKLIKTQLQFQTAQLGDKVEYQLEEAVKELKNENLNFKDEIISKILPLKQDLIANSSHKREIADHESRISKIEKRLFSN